MRKRRVVDIMRRSEYREIQSKRGRHSQQVQRNERLAAALEFGTIREIEPILLFEVRTWNTARKTRHLIEIWHRPGEGSKFTVYLDGERWRNGWSVSRFTRWIATQIDKAVEMD